MEPRLRRIVNAIWGLLLLSVVVDHFTQFSYRHFVRFLVRTDLSMYMEISSIVFTMGVPFFYSLYKRRENELEAVAIESGEGLDGLEEARKRNDLRIILYYSLMALFVVTLLFIQSSIINAGKAETSNLEHMVFNLQQELDDYKKQIEEVNGRLAKLDSLLQDISGQNERVQSVLKEVRSIRSSADVLARKMEKALQNVVPPNVKQANFATVPGLGEQLNAIQKELERASKSSEELSAALREELGKTREEILSELKRVARDVERVDSKLGRVRAIPNVPPKSKASGSTLSAADVQLLRRYVARYYDDFVATNGSFSVPHFGETQQGLLGAFGTYLRNSGWSLDQVSRELKQHLEMLKRAHDLCQQGKLEGIGNCEPKIRWLMWVAESS